MAEQVRRFVEPIEDGGDVARETLDDVEAGLRARVGDTAVDGLLAVPDVAAEATGTG